MKRIYIISLYAAAISLWASCSNFLDVVPKDKVLEEDQYKTEERINGVLNGLYRQMVSNTLYGANLSQTTVEVMGHVYTFPLSKPTDNFTYTTIYCIANGNYEESGTVESIFAGIWREGYKTLLNINSFIESVDKSTAVMEANHKDIMMGEAYGLRAYLHFDLFRLYGPRWEDRSSSERVLPYNRSADVILNHTNYEDDVYSTADEYMAYVLEDISKAEELLSMDPARTEPASMTEALEEDFYKNRNRRMNYFAVQALKARALQYMGDYANAAIAAKTVVDQVGESGNVGKLFRWANATSVTSSSNYSFFTEVVFGLDSPDMTSNYETFFEKTDLRDLYVVDRNQLVKAIYSDFGDNLKAMTDIRSRQWIESNNQSSYSYALSGTYISSKFNISSNSLIPALVDFQPLVRITEMYYIMADAALQAGDKATATQLLNTVVTHRGIPETSTYFLSETADDNIFNAHLEKEYYKEFYGEGQVYFYHKRKKSRQMYSGSGETKIDIDMERMYKMPIPKSEADI